MPRNAINCQATVSWLLRHAVKHAAGISAAEYFGTLEDPLFWTGQGSGSSGAIWLCLVVVLLNCLDRLSAEEDQIPGQKFSDPWNKIIEQCSVSAFVDKTNRGVMDPLGTLLSPDELVEQLRRAGQLWEKLPFILDRLSAEDDEIPGLKFSDPRNEIIEQWSIGAFVDNTNQGVMDPLGTLSPDELVEQRCRAGQLWEKLPFISGGALNLAKCSCWTLQYW